jgi:small subunit ribosomal protein S2
VPDAVFVVDLRKEQLAVREARRLGLPVIALVDTNCDPDDADYVIPGNDDAIRSCSLIVRVIADAIDAGKSKVTAEEMAAPVPEPEAAAAPAPEPQAQAADAPAAEAAPETEPQAAAVAVAEPAPPEPPEAKAEEPEPEPEKPAESGEEAE